MIQFWMTQICTVQRLTATVDAVGGQVNTWAVWTYDTATGATTENLKCFVWRTGSEKNDQSMGLPMGLGLHTFVFEAHFSPKIGDRILYESQYYTIEGTTEHYLNPASGEYLVQCAGMLKETA